MAIIKINENKDGLQLTINNGDLKALNQIKDKWGFRDSENILRFALAALTLTDDGYLYVEQKDGTRRMLKPAEELLIGRKMRDESHT